MAKWVYGFGDGKAEGRAEMKNLLGGKGANLAEMSNLGLPVPAGLHDHHRGLHVLLRQRPPVPARARAARSTDALRKVEEAIGAQVRRRQRAAARLGALRRARLDAGHDGHGPQPRPQRRDACEGLARADGNERFAWDSYRRFVQMYGDVVLGVEHAAVRASCSRTTSSEQGRCSSTPSSTPPTWQGAGRRTSSARSSSETGQAVPGGPAGAALGRDRRRVRLAGRTSAPSSTAGCTASPTTGARRSTSRRWSSATWATTAPPASPSRATRRPARTSFYGEYLINAQGEDVVAGIRTPQPDQGKQASARAASDGRGDAEVYQASSTASASSSRSTTATCRTSSSRSRSGKLCMLQTRNGKRTGRGRAARSPSTWCDEGLIDEADGRDARRAGRARPAAAPDVRSRRRKRDAAGARPAGLAGRGVGHGRRSPPTTPRRAAEQRRDR